MQVFFSPENLAKEFNISLPTVRRRMIEIEEQVSRYGDKAVIRDGKIVLVSILAFLDWERYRQSIRNGIPVPAFSPKEWLRMFGTNEKEVTECG